MTAFKPAGKYTLDSFLIYPIAPDAEVGVGESGLSSDAIKNKSVDLKLIVHTWDLTESFTSGHLKGTARVLDSEGIYYGYPLRGQERIRIVYTDFYGNQRTEDMFLYSITDIESGKESDDAVLMYTLHFVSFAKFWSDRYSVSRCIADGTRENRRYMPVSDQVGVLFDDYYSSDGRGTQKGIIIHETDGIQKIVIPNMKPDKAMHLFSRKAYSSIFTSSYFRFFESRDSFMFANVEELVFNGTVKKKLIHNAAPPDQTPDAEAAKMNAILRLNFTTQIDTLKDLHGGTYYKKLAEIDITNRRVNDYEYKHLEEYGEFNYPGGKGVDRRLAHSDEFINTHLNNWETTYVIKDYADADMDNAHGIRPKTFYGDIYTNKISHTTDYNATRFNIRIYGDNNIVVGDLIEIEMPYFNVSGDMDKERSGVYLVESIKNTFFENTYTQQMTISKGPITKE